MVVPMFHTHRSLEKHMQRVLRGLTHGGMGCHWEQTENV